MMIGNTALFAIESGITQAYDRPSLRALGFFVIHIGGRRYGVYKPDATMLACSFDEVTARIAARGNHVASFALEANAGEIADAFQAAIYAEEQDESYFGIPLIAFRNVFYHEGMDVMWSPDGDAAFDDGSFILQFDVEDRVRLIAFSCNEPYRHDPTTLRDVWLPAMDYYRVLREWVAAFEAEWRAAPKLSV
jgi:hypothetical protein